MSDTPLPPELPLDPKGWTKQMNVHFNFGREGGSASYTIYAPDGNAMPFWYQYDTRKGGLTGFVLPDVEGVMTWAQLVAAWPAFVARAAIKQVEGGK